MGSAQGLLHCTVLGSQEGLQLVDAPEGARVGGILGQLGLLVFSCDRAHRQAGRGGRNASKAEVLGSQRNLLEETPGFVT